MAARITGVIVVLVAGIILAAILTDRQGNIPEDPPRPEAAWVDCICAADDGDNLASISARCQTLPDQVIVAYGNGWCE